MARHPATRRDNPNIKGLPDRIRLLADLAGSTSALAEATGWTLRMVQRYASGAVLPTRSKLIHLAVITGCKLAWLEDGEGAAPTDPSAILTALRRATRNIEEDWHSVVPLPGETFSCPIHIASRAWVESMLGKLSSAEPLGSMRVKDASMAPIFLPGDLVLVAPIRSHEDSEIVPWKDYAIRAYGEWYIRRKTPHGWDAITQGAVNFPFDSNLVEVYGRVFAKVQVL